PLFGAAELLAGVRLYVARRLVRRDVEAELVRRALANTRGDVELVAEVLGVPHADVARLAGGTSGPTWTRGAEHSAGAQGGRHSSLGGSDAAGGPRRVGPGQPLRLA